MRPHVTRAQQRALDWLTDVVHVTRDTGTATIHPTTYAITAPQQVVWRGPALVSAAAPRARRDAGMGPFAEADTKVRVDTTAPPLEAGDTITVAASENADLVGAVMEVVGTEHGGIVVTRIIWCRRVILDESR